MIGADGGRRRRRAMRILVVILAIGQPVSSLIFDWLSPVMMESGAEFSPLIPPGAWFAIWGLIIVASIAWSLVQVRPSSITDAPNPRDHIAGPMAIVYLCFGLWLATATLGQENPLGLAVFLVIIGAHVVAWRRVSQAREKIARWAWWERGLLYLMLGTYSGWTAMAFFVQIATVTQGTGAEVETPWGVTWQVLVLAAATGLAVGFAILSRGSIVFAATVTYALVGVGISAADAGLAILWITCVIGVSALWASVIVIRWRDPQTSQTARLR